MSRWTAGLGAVVVLALAGCGGGGSDAPTTGSDPSAEAAQAAASAYATQLDAFARRLEDAGDNDRRLATVAAEAPQLRAVRSDDPAYARAKATADAVTTTARELRLVASEPTKRAGHLSYLQYDIGSDHWQDAFDSGNRRYDQLAAILYADDGSFADTTRADDLHVQRIWRAGVRQMIASFRRSAERMDRLKTRNALERSTVDYALDEYDRSIALLKEFGTQLRQPPERDQIGYYTSLAAGQNGYHDQAGAVVRHRDGLERGFVRTISRLAAGQQAAPGDAYRTAILAGFLSPLKKTKRRPNIVGERAWMLFRIKQIERTPQQAYDEARLTLQLENIDDNRNAYTAALEVYQQHDTATSPKGQRLPLVPTYRSWAHEKLTETYPPLLQPMVRRMDTLIRQYPDRANWDKIIKLNRQVEQALRKGAKAADDPKQLKAALRDALDATRPGSGTSA